MATGGEEAAVAVQSLRAASAKARARLRLARASHALGAADHRVAAALGLPCGLLPRRVYSPDGGASLARPVRCWAKGSVRAGTRTTSTCSTFYRARRRPRPRGRAASAEAASTLATFLGGSSSCKARRADLDTSPATLARATINLGLLTLRPFTGTSTVRPLHACLR